MKERIKNLQRKLGVQDDGDIGNETLAALEKALGIVVEPDSNLIDRLIAIAKKEVGIFETSKNHGVGIEKYWEATTYPDGYKNREPYCAAALCWMIEQLNHFTEKNRPKSARAFDFENWAKVQKLKLTMNPKKVKRGDIVIFEFSHIALAVSDSDSTGLFQTIEGNTNPAGSREGDGVYKKTRNVSSLRSSITL